MPVGGAPEKVRDVPDTAYVEGSCVIPEMLTNTDEELAGATDIVKVVADPLPEKESVTKACVITEFPIDDTIIPLSMGQHDPYF